MVISMALLIDGGTAYRGDITTFNPGPGTVFKIDTNGTLTTLYLFTGGNDGANPTAKLVQGSDGNFYGSTFGGGTNMVVGHRFQNEYQRGADEFIFIQSGR